MKSFEELEDRFDSIPELSVSEEMLGAYIDGVLSNDEINDLENIINADSDIVSLLNNVSEISSLNGMLESTINIGDCYSSSLNYDSFDDDSAMFIDYSTHDDPLFENEYFNPNDEHNDRLEIDNDNYDASFDNDDEVL